MHLRLIDWTLAYLDSVQVFFGLLVVNLVGTLLTLMLLGVFG